LVKSSMPSKGGVEKAEARQHEIGLPGLRFAAFQVCVFNSLREPTRP